eukprot:747371-Hanusia_phi.AAC.3
MGVVSAKDLVGWVTRKRAGWVGYVGGAKEPFEGEGGKWGHEGVVHLRGGPPEGGRKASAGWSEVEHRRGLEAVRERVVVESSDIGVGVGRVGGRFWGELINHFR